MNSTTGWALTVSAIMVGTSPSRICGIEVPPENEEKGTIRKLRVRGRRVANQPLRRWQARSRRFGGRCRLSDPPRLVGLHMGIGDPQQPSGVGWLAGPRQQVAENMIGLDRRASLDVAQHRGGDGRAGSGKHGAAALDGRLTGPEALPGGNGGAFVEQRRTQIVSVRGNDVADGGAHQTSDSGRGRDEYPLLPHLLENGLAHSCLELG